MASCLRPPLLGKISCQTRARHESCGIGGSPLMVIRIDKDNLKSFHSIYNVSMQTD